MAQLVPKVSLDQLVHKVELDQQVQLDCKEEMAALVQQGPQDTLECLVGMEALVLKVLLVILV